jgi:predicted RNA methylase
MGAEQYQEAWSSLGIDPDGYTFVDLGSGKGKVLLLAAALPFRRIIGVEFSPLLHEIAVRNIARYLGPVRCTPESICIDARDFEFPPGPLVVFLYNSFVDEVLSTVMANLERSLREDPRPAHVMYSCPLEADILSPFWIKSHGSSAMILRPDLEIPPRHAAVSRP